MLFLEEDRDRTTRRSIKKGSLEWERSNDKEVKTYLYLGEFRRLKTPNVAPNYNDEGKQ